MRNYADEFISAQLHRAVRNGDSPEEVSAQLGVDGVNIDAAPTVLHLAEVLHLRARQGPSGFRPTDEFLSFDFASYGIVLQFRNGRLINHDPSEYGTASRITLRKLRATPVGYQLTQFAWEMGGLQMIAALVATSSLFAAIVLAQRRSYSPTALKTIIVVPVVLSTAIICHTAGLHPPSSAWLAVGFTGTAVWYAVGAFMSRLDKRRPAQH